MGNIVTILEFSVLTGLVNTTNFIMFFISLVIVFFLLGIIMGITINNKNVSKDKTSPNKIDSFDKSRPTNTLGQDSEEKAIQQSYNSDSEPSTSRHRHHRHHRHSSKS